MRTFGRSIALSSWQKSHILGTHKRSTGEEAEAHLLALDEEREPQTLRDYWDGESLVNNVYVEKITNLESYCKSLEKKVSRMEYASREQKNTRDAEDKKFMVAMKQMTNKIKHLEDDNKMLTEVLNERDAGMDVQNHVSGVSADATSAVFNSASKRRRVKGADWSIVSDLARRLSQSQTENSTLRQAMVAKREAIEELIQSTTDLRSKLEHAQYENLRLTRKCESLGNALSFLANDDEAVFGEARTQKQESGFLQARVDELEETNELLQDELQGLKKVIRATHAPDQGNNRENCVEDVRDSNIVDKSIKGSEEPLQIVVETVPEESDTESQGMVVETGASDPDPSVVAQSSQSSNASPATDNEYKAPSECSSAAVSEGERMDTIGPLRSDLFGWNQRATNDRPRPASLDEMNTYLRDMAKQIYAGNRNRANGAGGYGTGEYDMPASQVISGGRRDALKTTDEHPRWRDKVRLGAKNDDTKGVEGIWC